MYRVLLADDEGIMLESLKKIIEGSFGQECEIAMAKTGRAVVELAETFRPDIAFMDIQMPGLNGIQAIKEIQKNNKNTIFIIITAYDQFDYAKEAINLGVMEFLTKPVNKKVVLDVLVQAMNKVDETRKKRSDDLKIREKLEIVIPILESGYIYELLLANRGISSGENYRTLLDIKEEYAYIIVLEFGDAGENGTLTNEVGARVRAEKFYPELREMVKGYFHCVVGPVMGNQVVLLVPYEKKEVSYEERVRILERTRNMVYKLEERISGRFRGGIGYIKEIGEVSASYDDAVKALRHSDSHVVHVKDIPGTKAYDGEYPSEIEKKYFQYVKKADEKNALKQAGIFFDWMTQNFADNKDEIALKVLEFIILAEREASEQDGVPYGFGYRKAYLGMVQSFQNYGELRRWFLIKTSEICQNIATSRETQTETLVSKVKTYIEENYQKDISLDEVSRLVDISPYYFSKLFKQEAGKNFIEYLTEIRMRHAEEFLRDPSYSIKEVCVMSGYSDPNYFSRLFKKYESVTPSEYRERL